MTGDLISEVTLPDTAENALSVTTKRAWPRWTSQPITQVWISSYVSIRKVTRTNVTPISLDALRHRDNGSHSFSPTDPVGQCAKKASVLSKNRCESVSSSQAHPNTLKHGGGQMHLIHPTCVRIWFERPPGVGKADPCQDLARGVA